MQYLCHYIHNFIHSLATCVKIVKYVAIIIHMYILLCMYVD